MIISVNNLFVKYGNHTVLQDISFEVQAGDFLGIVGPNGSGKSTLVKTLVGLLPAASGRVDIQQAPGSASIGYLPQNSSAQPVNFPATVKEVVASGLISSRRFPRWFRRQDFHKIDEALELLQVKDLKHKRIGELSGGQQQRVHLARALVSNSKLLILDEPTGALDPTSRDCFYQTLDNLNKHNRITILLVSHDSHTIGRYINTILFLDRKVLFSGAYKDFQNSETQVHYFGTGHTHECTRDQEGTPHV